MRHSLCLLCVLIVETSVELFLLAIRLFILNSKGENIRPNLRRIDSQ